jgi:hypothetical protein
VTASPARHGWLLLADFVRNRKRATVVTAEVVAVDDRVSSPDLVPIVRSANPLAMVGPCLTTATSDGHILPQLRFLSRLATIYVKEKATGRHARRLRR